MIILVRPARETDADAAVAVLRRSIEELCAADHHDDRRKLTEWLANKTPENAATWSADPDLIMRVAEGGPAIVGVGLAHKDGAILLNYVAPQARLSGVSTALLDALEQALRERGIATATLESTETAHRFYRARGYIDDADTDGPPYAMSKVL